MELAPGEFETLGHLVYGPIRDFCEVVGVLEQMGKRVLLGGEAGRERRLTQMLAAYSSHNLSEILTLRSESIQHDNSLFAFLSKVSCLEIEVYRHLSKGLTEVGQVLHDSSELVSKMCSLRSGYGDLKSTANDSIPYSLGVVPIQSLVYKSAKAKFDLSELNHPNKLTSNTQKTNKIYGFKAEPKKIALKGALFRLYSDAIDGNYEVLDADLRTYAQLLNEQGLITDPSEKIAQLKQTVAMLKTREAAQKAEEALKEQEFYGGRFESEEELQSYKLALSGKFCKYQLMLFEGLWRITRGHSSDTGGFNGLAELDPVMRLTEWKQVSRHFDVVEMMGKEIVEGVIPREDFLQFQMIKAGDRFDTSETVSLHPCILPLISEAITGPFFTLSLLQSLYLQALSAASTRVLENPDNTEIDPMKFQLQRMYREMYTLGRYLERYLEIQLGMSYAEERVREITAMSSFPVYGLCGGLEQSVYTRIVTNIRQSNEWALRSLLDILQTVLQTFHV